MILAFGSFSRGRVSCSEHEKDRSSGWRTRVDSTDTAGLRAARGRPPTARRRPRHRRRLRRPASSGRARSACHDRLYARGQALPPGLALARVGRPPDAGARSQRPGGDGRPAAGRVPLAGPSEADAAGLDRPLFQWLTGACRPLEGAACRRRYGPGAGRRGAGRHRAAGLGAARDGAAALGSARRRPALLHRQPRRRGCGTA